MRILLFEPGVGGHRLVVLRYITTALSESGHECVHVSRNFDEAPLGLAFEARRLGCDVIFYLMIDGRALHACLVSNIAACFGIRTVAIYYLYNNFTEFPNSWIWKSVVCCSCIDAIFISDERLLKSPSLYPDACKFLPDPWDPGDFPVVSKQHARATIGISPSSFVFTMFGELDARKGADLFVKAALLFTKANPELDVVFMLAGKHSPEIISIISNAREVGDGGRIVSMNTRIPEDKVSLYFYASDFIVCPYPSYFKVSSGTVTRALAAGRPIISSSHGATGELVGKNGIGILFSAGDCLGLANAFFEALDSNGKFNVQCIFEKLSRPRALDRYKQTLTEFFCREELALVI
jgi:glycosyltransferase involved in cell wall biosynthesis